LLVRAKKQKTPTSKASKDLNLLTPPLSSERSEDNLLFTLQSISNLKISLNQLLQHSILMDIKFLCLI
jgi:hypothetical protein